MPALEDSDTDLGGVSADAGNDVDWDDHVSAFQHLVSVRGGRVCAAANAIPGAQTAVGRVNSEDVGDTLQQGSWITEAEKCS